MDENLGRIADALEKIAQKIDCQTDCLEKIAKSLARIAHTEYRGAILVQRRG
jgi:hypothetical protein